MSSNFFLLYKIVVLKLELLSIHSDNLIFYLIQIIYLFIFDIVGRTPWWAVSWSSCLTFILLFFHLLELILIVLAQVTAGWYKTVWGYIGTAIITFLWRKWIKSFYPICWRFQVCFTLQVILISFDAFIAFFIIVLEGSNNSNEILGLLDILWDIFLIFFNRKTEKPIFNIYNQRIVTTTIVS